jgi:hypothetical protein
LKISQEVREFARLQNQDSAGFIAASPDTVRPEEGQTPDLIRGKARLEGVGSRRDAETTEEWAEKGMAKMSKEFRQEGGEIYLPTE